MAFRRGEWRPANTADRHCQVSVAALRGRPLDISCVRDLARKTKADVGRNAFQLVVVFTVPLVAAITLFRLTVGINSSGAGAKSPG